jgi:hypothetical protein
VRRQERLRPRLHSGKVRVGRCSGKQSLTIECTCLPPPPPKSRTDVLLLHSKKYVHISIYICCATNCNPDNFQIFSASLSHHSGRRQLLWLQILFIPVAKLALDPVGPVHRDFRGWLECVWLWFKLLFLSPSGLLQKKIY